MKQSFVNIQRRQFLSGHWRSPSEQPSSTAECSEINNRCLNLQGVYCQTCKESCEHSAIVFQHKALGVQVPLIDSELCTACSDCVDSCPVHAITIIDNVQNNNV